jgi:hypothetical protein
MDAATWTQLVLGSLLGAGGLAGVFNAIAALRARKKGAPGAETDARVEADTQGFAAYLRAEVRRERAAGNARVDNVQKKLDAAEEFIDVLETHIWKTTGQAPPARHHPEEGKDNG